MSVLSDISSKLTQAHSADSEKQRIADYSEAFGYLLADVLNKNSSLINPFIRKGAQRRIHFNELDQVEQEKEKTSEPKTAAEQGYVSTDEQAEIRERIESYGYENTARQKGITIQVPTEDVGVSKNKKDRMGSHVD